MCNNGGGSVHISWNPPIPLLLPTLSLLQSIDWYFLSFECSPLLGVALLCIRIEGYTLLRIRHISTYVCTRIHISLHICIHIFCLSIELSLCAASQMWVKHRSPHRSPIRSGALCGCYVLIVECQSPFLHPFFHCTPSILLILFIFL